MNNRSAWESRYKFMESISKQHASPLSCTIWVKPCKPYLLGINFWFAYRCSTGSSHNLGSLWLICYWLSIWHQRTLIRAWRGLSCCSLCRDAIITACCFWNWLDLLHTIRRATVMTVLLHLICSPGRGIRIAGAQNTALICLYIAIRKSFARGSCSNGQLLQGNGGFGKSCCCLRSAWIRWRGDAQRVLCSTQKQRKESGTERDERAGRCRVPAPLLTL